MGQVQAWCVLVAYALMVAGLVFSAWLVVRRWRDDRFWLGYRARLQETRGGKAGARFVRGLPVAVALGSMLIVTGSPVMPDVWAVAHGAYRGSRLENEWFSTAPTWAAVAVTVGLGVVVLLGVVAICVHWWARPRFVIPPALRPESRKQHRQARY